MPPKRAAVPKPRAGAKKKKTANGYTFPEHIPSGFIVKDTQNKQYEIKDTIGVGGFGEIYSATSSGGTPSKNKKPYFAVKVEPKGNGPLFVEMHFFMRVCKEEDILQWVKKSKLKTFGLPVYRGSGSFEYKSNDYRFVVTDRLEKDLSKILEENNHQLPVSAVIQIGVQVINVLEYIHSKGYIHADIKAMNLMFGLKPGTENTVYLIDFGLANKCVVTDKELKSDPKKANNGTIEYISRDGHNGVFGFRGDMEILGFNMLHWVAGSLPWDKDITKPDVVVQKKTELMKDPAKYIKKNLLKVPTDIINYLHYIASLKNNDVPDYDHCKKILMKTHSKINPYGKLLMTNK